ncbi:MAG: hypothetical protein JNL82_16430 [Myxococcales bacterium]|jgi:hypothetical protein|nr:hypothetical protein [Myxococcales bacterium]
MAVSHFSSIGLQVASAADMQALIDRVVEDAEYVEARGGVYVVWQAGDGPELWLQCDEDNTVIGLAPHFVGGSRVRIGLVAAIERPGQTALDGSYFAWVNPRGEDYTEGDYPLVFDCPDAAALEVEPPCETTVQLAAFAHHVEVWADAEAYERGQQAEPRLASRSFIPAGLFRGEDEAEPGPPVAYALITGHVTAAEVRVNPLSGANYWWAAVATHGATIDVVLAVELVSDGLRVGNVLSGGFWLSGQVVGEDA